MIHSDIKPSLIFISQREIWKFITEHLQTADEWRVSQQPFEHYTGRELQRIKYY